MRSERPLPHARHEMARLENFILPHIAEPAAMPAGAGRIAAYIEAFHPDREFAFENLDRLDALEDRDRKDHRCTVAERGAAERGLVDLVLHRGGAGAVRAE